MKRSTPFVSIAMLFAAGAALAQPPAPGEFDSTQPIVLEGQAKAVTFAVGGVLVELESGGLRWEVKLPGSQALIAQGIGAEVLHHGSHVKLTVLPSNDGTCQPSCKAQALDITTGEPRRTVAFVPASRG